MTAIRQIIIILLLIQPLVASAALSEAEKTRRIEAFVESIEPKLSRLQGGVIAILDKDKVVYQKAFGHERE